MRLWLAIDFVRLVIEALRFDAAKPLQQDGVQSFAALRSDRMQGEKRKHHRILRTSW
jgi:hypothetical protein